jgi:putative two-component system hydrogenase maturation factor HypX/HoxX
VLEVTSLTDALRRSPNPLRGDAPARHPARALRVLFLVSAHNSLSQRAYIALTELGHSVEVAVVESSEQMEAAVARHRPELIVCPILKKIIPESIWANHRCLIVHPGPVGDRGASSLDWAIELGMAEWGVTVLEATGEVDGGDIWATRSFRTRDTGKSSLYRHEVRRAAIASLEEAMAGLAADGFQPRRLDYDDPLVTGRPRPLIRQPERAIDWSADGTATVVRRIRAAEGHPGVFDIVDGVEFHLFGVHAERMLRGRPGEIIARRDGAICRATVDGAVWITHLKRADEDGRTFFKLPATRALELAGRPVDAPEFAVPVHAPIPDGSTYREISYTEHADVGHLRFDFYNGAMSTDQCRRLLEAYRYARSRRTKVIVLAGGDDFFSNGIHLNVIEAANDPAEESWWNLHAIDDVVREIVETDSHLVISALAGDAAAGGVPFALAADHVVARQDVVLNPYYQHMGGLYGSEYWTYLLPRRVGAETAAELTSAPFMPVGTRRAVEIGLLDAAFGEDLATYRAQVRGLAERLARHGDHAHWLEHKRRARTRDEQAKPLSVYRTEELARSHECFFGPDRSYHEARHRFVHKLGAPCAVPAPQPVPSAMTAVLQSAVGNASR